MLIQNIKDEEINIDDNDINTNPTIESKPKDEVRDMRQDEVDDLLEKSAVQLQFSKLTEKFESDDSKEINKALKELANLSNTEFAAFKQYLENNNKNLDEVLTNIEKKADVKESRINTVYERYDEVEAWLNADDIEEIEEAEVVLHPSEIGKDRDEVAELRQERIDSLLEKRTTKRQFSRLETELKSSDKEELNKALKEVSKMPVEKFAAFKQYLEKSNTSLETILTLATAKSLTEEVNKDTIDKIKDKEAQAQDWLRALDVRKE